MSAKRNKWTSVSKDYLDVIISLIKSFNSFTRCDYILGHDGNPKPFSLQDQEDMVANVIEPMANYGLRTLCLAFKHFVHGKKKKVFIYILKLLSRLLFIKADFCWCSVGQ